MKLQIRISANEPYAAMAVYNAIHPVLSVSAQPLTWQTGVTKTMAPVLLLLHVICIVVYLNEGLVLVNDITEY
jgi:hypothetical protein